MPLMQMARNWTVSTDLGHTVKFFKNKPCFIPDDPRVVERCLAAGATYVEAAPPLPDEKKETPVVLTKDQMQAKCVELFKEMTGNMEKYRENFTALGRPNAKYISSRVGTEISAKEVEEFWTAFRVAK